MKKANSLVYRYGKVKKRQPSGAIKSAIAKAKKAGHDSLFEKYHISVVSVIRKYTDKDRT
jgi:hypothetical protein